jgi:hypothetical protein
MDVQDEQEIQASKQHGIRNIPFFWRHVDGRKGVVVVFDRKGVRRYIIDYENNYGDELNIILRRFSKPFIRGGTEASGGWTPDKKCHLRPRRRSPTTREAQLSPVDLETGRAAVVHILLIRYFIPMHTNNNVVQLGPGGDL